MGLVLRPSQRRVLSASKLRIDWSHPLTNRLMGCWVPGVMKGVDLTGYFPTLATDLVGSTVDNENMVAAEGPAYGKLPSGSTTDIGKLGTNSLPPRLTSWSSISAYYRGDRNGVGYSSSTIPYLIYLAPDNGLIPPYNVFGIGGASATDLSDCCAQWNSGGANASTTPTISFDQAGTISMLGTFKVGGNGILYKNGVQVASAAFGASAPTYGTTPTFAIHGWYGTGRRSPTLCYVAFVWDRELSANEAALLDADPYCFLVPDEGEWSALAPLAPPQFSGRGGPVARRRILSAYSGGLDLPGVQPRGPAKIDWSHPILKGISYLRVFNKNKGAQPDFIDNGYDSNLSDASTSPVIGPAQGGIGLTSSGIFTHSNAYNVPQSAGTFVAYTTVSWSPTDNIYHKMAYISDNGDSSDFTILKYLDNNWYAGWYNAGDWRVVTAAAGTFNAGDTFSIAATWNVFGTSIHIKGIQRGNYTSTPATFATGSGGNGDFAIGGGSPPTGSAAPWAPTVGSDAIHYVAFWSRVLSADEIALLNDDPYCFLIPAESEMSALNAATAATFLAAWARRSNPPVLGTGNF